MEASDIRAKQVRGSYINIFIFSKIFFSFARGNSRIGALSGLCFSPSYQMLIDGFLLLNTIQDVLFLDFYAFAGAVILIFTMMALAEQFLMLLLAVHLFKLSITPSFTCCHFLSRSMHILLFWWTRLQSMLSAGINRCVLRFKRYRKLIIDRNILQNISVPCDVRQAYANSSSWQFGVENHTKVSVPDTLK